jgi:hypothetical protein
MIGEDYFVKKDRSRQAERLTKPLRDLGYEVTINQDA